MSWTFVLEDEDKKPIVSLSEKFTTGVNLNQEAFRVLRYLGSLWEHHLQLDSTTGFAS